MAGCSRRHCKSVGWSANGANRQAGTDQRRSQQSNVWTKASRPVGLTSSLIAGICRFQPQQTSHGHSSLHGAQALRAAGVRVCVAHCLFCRDAAPPSLHESVAKCCEGSPQVPFRHRYWSEYCIHNRAWLHLQHSLSLSRQLAGNKASFQASLAAKCDSLVCELH